MKKLSLVFLGTTLVYIWLLYMMKLVLDSSFDIKYANWGALTLLSLWAIFIILLCIVFGKYLSTYSHNYRAAPYLFFGLYSLTMILFLAVLPFVTLKWHYIVLIKYPYLAAVTVTIIAASIYFWHRAANLTKINFDGLYYLTNGKVFFDHFHYGEKISRDLPGIYTKFVFSIFGFGLSFGFLAQASYSDTKWAIGLGLASLSLFFVAYPMFIYALYFLLVVHPHAAKAFKQPVLSDPMDVFKVAVGSLGVRLENDIIGENSTKRVIKYEEVFHK